MKSTVINNNNSETPNQPHPEQQNVNANQANNGQPNNDQFRRPQFRVSSTFFLVPNYHFNVMCKNDVKKLNLSKE